MTPSKKRGQRAADRDNRTGAHSEDETLSATVTQLVSHKDALSHIATCQECKLKLFVLFCESLELDIERDAMVQFIAS